MKQGRIKNIENILKNKKIKTHGVEIDLTEEQLQKLQQLVEPKYKNPFERVDEDEEYYAIDVLSAEFKVVKFNEDYFDSDNKRFKSGNYYNNKGFAEQVAMDMNLQQKLRKFVYENSGGKELWKCKDVGKYYIALDADFNKWIWRLEWFERNPFQVYFKDLETVERAIEEVVRPFCKENPNYRFQEE